MDGPIEPLEPRRMLALSLLADLNATNGSSSASPPVVVGSVGYFAAAKGAEAGLWRTDGTAAGTTLAWNGSGATGSIKSLTNVSGQLFFTASSSYSGQLWKSDGTASGTVLLATVSGSQSFTANQIIDLNGVAIVATTYYGVWRSDGTPAGTYQIAPLRSSGVARLGDFGYFVGGAGLDGAMGLWRTDGTVAGTTLVRQFSGVFKTTITAANGRLYFSTTDSATTTDQEPWSSDGTTAGTVPLGDLRSGSTSSSPSCYVAMGSAVYFIARPSSSDSYLFRTDGSLNSAAQVTKLGNLGVSSAATDPVIYNGALYLQGNAAATGIELWRSDGTAAGTGLFVDVNPGAASSSPRSLEIFNGRLYFEAATANEGIEMRSTDGTVAGTTLLKDIAPGALGMDPNSDAPQPTILNGRMYFRANDYAHGSELWSTDGTATSLLEDFNTKSNDFNPSAMVAGPGGFHYFTGYDGFHGTDLWKTDGTAAGTSLVKDVPGTSTPSRLTYVNGLLLFSANDGTSGTELWRSDGTDAGTYRVKDLAAGSGDGLVNVPFVKVGERIFFAASQANVSNYSSDGLWISDGTAAGTQLVKAPAADFSTWAFGGAELDGKLIFLANAGSLKSCGLYISDGTSAGTTLVKGGFVEHIFGNFTRFNGRVYFTASSGSPQHYELWRTDGTEAGTARVPGAPVTPNSTSFGSVVATNHGLYFTATDANGRELWRADDITGVASRVTTFPQDVGQIAPAARGGVLFTVGTEVYRFNGALAQLRSWGGSSTTLLGSANGLDYFAASGSTSSQVLWASDGTAAGTGIVGNGAIGPANLSVIGSDVFVSAYSGSVGREWFMLRPFAHAGADGTLTIEGDEGNDLIDVARVQDELVVSLLGATIIVPVVSAPAGVRVLGGGGTGDTITVSGGSVDFAADLSAGGTRMNIDVAAGAEAIFHSGQHLESLSISGSVHAASGGGYLIVTKSLALKPTGRLDLEDNGAIVDYSAGGASPIGAWNGSGYTGLLGKVAQGRNDDAWDGAGISSAAAQHSNGLTGVAIAEASAILKLAGSQTAAYRGETVDATCVIVKYTYVGDANLDGRLNGEDYAAIDSHANQNFFGFANGDFNFDGEINGDDYFILDGAIAEAQAGGVVL